MNSTLIIIILSIVGLILWQFISYKSFFARAKIIWDSNRELILKEIDSIGEEDFTSCLCYKSGTVDSEENVISIPESINNKWRGKTLEITIPQKLFDAGSENIVEVKISESQANVTQIGTSQFFCIKSPSVKLKNGKYQNLYSATKFIQKSAKLKELYKEFKGIKKYEALDLFLPDPIMLFSSPKWYQGPRFLKCSICKKNMILVAQIPGIYLAKRADKIFGHGDIYIFSCDAHIESFKSVIDIT